MTVMKFNNNNNNNNKKFKTQKINWNRTERKHKKKPTHHKNRLM